MAMSVSRAIAIFHRRDGVDLIDDSRGLAANAGDMRLQEGQGSRAIDQGSQLQGNPNIVEIATARVDGMEKHVGIAIVVIDDLGGKARFQATAVEHGRVGGAGAVGKGGDAGNRRILAMGRTRTVAVNNLTAVMVAEQ